MFCHTSTSQLALCQSMLITKNAFIVRLKFCFVSHLKLCLYQKKRSQFFYLRVDPFSEGLLCNVKESKQGSTNIVPPVKTQREIYRSLKQHISVTVMRKMLKR